MRLVASSETGAVDRDEALHLLTERALLTRTVCRELLDAQGSYGRRRPRTALLSLLIWVQENFPQSVVIEPHAGDGIDAMTVPEDCQELLQEIRDGANVCECLFMLTTADTSSDAEHDREHIHSALDRYWKNRGEVVNSPWS